MSSGHPLFPQVLWAQRKDNVFLTVEVQDAQDLKIDLEEKSLKFHAKSGGNDYEFALNFPEKINKESSKWSANRVVHILLAKEEKKRWPKLDVDKSKAHWLKCDWDKWLDTDEEENAGKGRGGGGGGPMDWSSMMGGGDMDFSSMMGANGGGMGGMGGMGDMGDMGDMGGLDEEDVSDDEDGDEDEELDKVDEPVNLDGDLNGPKVADVKGDLHEPKAADLSGKSNPAEVEGVVH